MEAAPGNIGISTFVTWGSSPARRDTIVAQCDIRMNSSDRQVKILSKSLVFEHDICRVRPNLAALVGISATPILHCCSFML